MASSPVTGPEPSDRWTVDELARAAGTTTRQVRSLQTQGLLPGPELVGRTGYYDAGHLDRLRAILRLQTDGFSRAALVVLLRGWEADMTLAQVLGLPSQAGRTSETDADEPDVFSGLTAAVDGPSTRRGRILSLVPSTILDQAAAS